MKIQKATEEVFEQLILPVKELSDEAYARPIDVLFNATIGQHVRHIIELYICLFNGYESGIINYEKRKRDSRIETDKDFALELIQMITGNLNKINKDLILEGNYDNDSPEFTVPTNFYREIIYNLEHTVHHMALIRVGLNEISSITIPDGFGVASSTIKHRKECAQ